MGRVVATGAIVVAGLGLLAACGWEMGKEKATDEANITDAFSSVQFVNDSGNIEITAGDRPSVKREIHYGDEKPGPTHRIEDGTLILESCPVDNCWIDYEVVVPEDSSVNGKLDSGNADISGVARLNLRADSGDITVHDIHGPVNLDVDSGNADLIDLRGAAQVQADSGNVTIALAVQNDVRARVSSGNVDVTVPKGAYRVDAEVDSGDLDNSIPNDDSADHQIALSADSGNITISTT